MGVELPLGVSSYPISVPARDPRYPLRARLGAASLCEAGFCPQIAYRIGPGWTQTWKGVAGTS